MLHKLSLITAKSRLPVHQAWATIATYLRAHRQRAHDARILAHMNDQNLRDIGLSRTQAGTRFRDY